MAGPGQSESGQWYAGGAAQFTPSNVSACCAIAEPAAKTHKSGSGNGFNGLYLI
jgi:hypothetical protein